MKNIQSVQGDSYQRYEVYNITIWLNLLSAWVVSKHNNPIASYKVYLNPSVNGGIFGGT